MAEYCPKCHGPGKRFLENSRVTPPPRGHPTMHTLWVVGNLGKAAVNQFCKCTKCGHIWLKLHW